MNNFQKKNNFKYILKSKLFLTIFFILIIFFIWSVIGFIGKANDTRRNKKIAEDKIIELNNQKEKLRIDIEKLKTEKGIEENIRNKFGFAKDGESVIVVVEDEKTNFEANTKKDNFFEHFIKNLFK